jgi:uncharacterized damage-inducible protein DinB
MKIRFAVLLSLTALPASVHAQAQATSAMKPLYESIKGFLIRSAEQMPEASYGFKATPEVRSFGQIIGHVASSSFAICSTAKGEKSPDAQEYDKVMGKAALVTALKAGFAYCDVAFTWPDAKFTETAEMFGMKMTRLGWLMLEIAHSNEHYGNLVTYFRLNKMVPPSSAP